MRAARTITVFQPVDVDVRGQRRRARRTPLGLGRTAREVPVHTDQVVRMELASLRASLAPRTDPGHDPAFTNVCDQRAHELRVGIEPRPFSWQPTALPVELPGLETSQRNSAWTSPMISRWVTDGTYDTARHSQRMLRGCSDRAPPGRELRDDLADRPRLQLTGPLPLPTLPPIPHHRIIGAGV